jgi:hypothetical protein
MFVPVGQLGNRRRIALGGEDAEAVSRDRLQKAHITNGNVMRELPRRARVGLGLVILVRVGHGLDGLVGVHPLALQPLPDQFGNAFGLICVHRFSFNRRH